LNIEIPMSIEYWFCYYNYVLNIDSMCIELLIYHWCIRIDKLYVCNIDLLNIDPKTSNFLSTLWGAHNGYEDVILLNG